MRFNFETARRGKCSIETHIQGVDVTATIQYGEAPNVRVIDYRVSCDFPENPSRRCDAESEESLARMIILNFETFGGMPDRKREIRAWVTGMRWNGELTLVN